MSSSKSPNPIIGVSTSGKQISRSSNSRSTQQMLYLKRQFNQIVTNRPNNQESPCSYLHRHCLQNRLEGYNYCIRHILHDRNAPYKQCSYQHPQTGKRCTNAARRLDRRDRDAAYCSWHIIQFNMLRRKNMNLQNYKSDSEAPKSEILKRKFEELEHYCPNNEHGHRRKNADWDLPDDKCVTASKSLTTKVNNSINAIHCQKDQEDFSNVMFANVLNLDSLDSDNESVESYLEDPLRHAGVFSAEEIAKNLRDKMLRLQTLYINMLNYYRYTLKNKMRQYYLANNNKNSKPNETLTSKSPRCEPETDPLNEEKDSKILKAMFKYHNMSGPEKLIKDEASKIRQSLVEEIKEKPHNQPICVYKKDSEQCRQQCIPLSNYCKTHILYDPYQFLFRPCANGSPPCLTPVVSYIHKNACTRHTQIKYEKTDIDKILKSPIKMESENETEHLNDALSLTHENEPEEPLFNSMEDIALQMDSVVETGNLFGLEQFDLDSSMLS